MVDGGGYMPASAGFSGARGCVAQLVEQLTLNQRVTGSIPVAPTSIINGLYPILEMRQRSVQPTPLGRAGRPVDVAPAALYFASDESSYCTGTELVVDGGLHAGMYVDVPGMFTTRA